MSLRALLLAPPGAGKGTQGTRLAERFDVRHLATGDLLRQHVADDTEIGREARSYMERGDLVPDEIVVALVATCIGGPPPLEGFVLDGFPRTLEQAEAAYGWGKERDRTFHAVISLDVDEDELVRRLVERGVQAGRADDTPDTIRARLEVYRAKTAPLLEFYEQRGILVGVDGTGEVDDVFARIVAALGPFLPPDRGNSAPIT
jgi:adenylate kinase